MAELPVRIGDVLAGKYRVERVLGEGGMGIVVAAHHLQLDERIALKFLLDEASSQKDLVARFLREAQMSAKIRNDHVARVTDVGVLESGIPYMVMEYLDGQDLDSLVQDGPRLSVGDAVDLLLQACEAIAEAHSLGIVHRDLKPSNLFVTRQRDGSPFVKVLDFGISKHASKTGDVSLTATNAVLGSPLYMSPEQMLDSRSVDARTDIWAIGVVLYEMLAQRPPFEGETIPEVSAKIAASPHAPIQTIRPDVPAGLAAAIDRALAKRPEDRFASIADFARALTPFALAESLPSVRRIEATSSGRMLVPAERDSSQRLIEIAHDPTIAADAKSSPERILRSTPAARGSGRLRLMLGVGLGVVVVVALAGAGWSWARRTSPTVAAPVLAAGSSTTAPSLVPPQPIVTAEPTGSSNPIASAPLASASPTSTAHGIVAKAPIVVAPRTTTLGVVPVPPPVIAAPANSQPFDSRK